MELISHHQQGELRNGQKVTPHVQLPHTILHAGILAEQGMDHQEGLWGKMIGWKQPGNSETASHMAEQFSWVPLPFCSPPGRPFPIKSLALSAHVSPRTLHFWVLDKSPVSGPGRGPLSYNTVSLSKAMLGFFTMLVTRILDHSSMDQIWNMLLSWCLKECDVNYSDEISVMAPLVTHTCDWSLS